MMTGPPGSSVTDLSVGEEVTNDEVVDDTCLSTTGTWNC